MADPTRISLELLDGTKVEYITRTFLCSADRVAFERRFDVGMGKFLALYNAADGKADEDATEAAVDSGGIREEWINFFVYRTAQRHAEVFRGVSFDDFLERVAEAEVDDVEESSGPDPTVPDPPST